MNKRQKEVMQATLDNERQVLEALEKNYTRALADIKHNIRELQSMPETQSRAYRIEFQRQLEKQIASHLDVLQGKNYSTINSYLQKCYEEGFVGGMYRLQGLGVGINLPISQERVIKAIQKTGDDLKLSSKLEGNVDVLKKNVLDEMQRGFASDLSYSDIARNISNCGEADMNRAMRIARTEGHRVQCEADMDSAEAAKDAGVDVVKVWNATLDDKTRESHQEVDGEWRELDEPFSNGLMYPGDPAGDAEEVINCRCTVDEVPRWYVEQGGAEYKRDNITGQIIKCKNYAEFKEKYLQNADYGVTMGTDNLSIRKQYDDLCRNIPNIIDKNAPIAEQAKEAYLLRNEYKVKARYSQFYGDDREGAKSLFTNRPLLSFDETVNNKMQRKGMTREEAFADIIGTAATTNEEVNKQVGLRR